MRGYRQLDAIVPAKTSEHPYCQKHRRQAFNAGPFIACSGTPRTPSGCTGS